MMSRTRGERAGRSTRPTARPESLARALADIARLGALAGIVAMAVSGRWGPVGQFVVILVVLLAQRRRRVPAVADAAFAVSFVVAAWAGAAHWYGQVMYLDVVVHFSTVGSGSAVAYLVLARIGVVPSVASPEAARYRWAPVLWVVLLGTALATLWEQYEWVVEQFAPAEIIVGYDDTVTDLMAGVAGSLVAGVLVRWHGTARR